jgi:hypothetical protein
MASDIWKEKNEMKPVYGKKKRRDAEDLLFILPI